MLLLLLLLFPMPRPDEVCGSWVGEGSSKGGIGVRGGGMGGLKAMSCDMATRAALWSDERVVLMSRLHAPRAQDGTSYTVGNVHAGVQIQMRSTQG